VDTRSLRKLKVPRTKPGRGHCTYLGTVLYRTVLYGSLSGTTSWQYIAAILPAHHLVRHCHSVYPYRSPRSRIFDSGEQRIRGDGEQPQDSRIFREFQIEKAPNQRQRKAKAKKGKGKNRDEVSKVSVLPVCP